MKPVKLLAVAVLIFTAIIAAAQSAPLKIGWAIESIDPNRPSVMPGFGTFRYSYGTEDPLYATCLVLENGKDSVIFVSLDVIGLREILPLVVEVARKNAPELPTDKFLINATHSHSSLNVYYPNTGIPKEFNLMDCTEIRSFLADKIVAAAKRAWNSRKPGKIAWGYGLGVTGFNRRTVYLEDISKRPKGSYGSAIAFAGKAIIHGRTYDDKFAGYENGPNNYIQFLYTFDMNDKLTGAIINTAATSQLANSPQRKYTSDFWHDVREKIHSKYPDCYILTQCAGAGDLMPNSEHYKEAERRRIRLKYGEKFLKDHIEKCTWPDTYPRKEYMAYRKAMRVETAERIFNTFEETLQWAQNAKISEAILRNKVLNLDLTPTPIPDELVEKAHATLKKWEKQPYKTDGTLEERGNFNFLRTNSINSAQGIIKRAEDVKKGIKHNTGVTLVRIGDVAFASNSFELFSDYMHRIQGRSPFIQTFVVELAGHMGRDQRGGYLATELAVRNRGYSATPNQCPVSPQGGQELVDATVKGLQEIFK